ncbi:MAG TPA: hypothetical protein VF579_08785, partial [Candidatus Methylomirabilis sp.]
SFAAYWPVGEEARQKAFRQFVAYQIAIGRREQARTGQVRYSPTEAGRSPETSCPIPLPAGARVEYAPDGSGFTLLMFPKTPFPFFPYNYLTSQPSYRAGGTGQIRMIEVHGRNTVCPPDAPVVAQVSQEEIEGMQRLLEGWATARDPEDGQGAGAGACRGWGAPAVQRVLERPPGVRPLKTGPDAADGPL